MSAKIIDGKKIADRIKTAVKRDIREIKNREKRTLKLACLRLGGDASSDIYINSQRRLAAELGIEYNLEKLPAGIKQAEAEKIIEELNRNDEVTGIIIQRPVPKQIDIKYLITGIAPHKDVEGLHPINMGRLTYGKWLVAPCTASACMTIIDSVGLGLRGKEVVIVGHSEIVGKPLSMMLLSKFATTTVCHIGTYEKGLLKDHVKRAQILIVSVGKSRLIKGSWIRDGAFVIDVGINRSRGKITGDVDFKEAVKRASYITPVPGGVGPVTSVILMKNLVALHKNICG